MLRPYKEELAGGLQLIISFMTMKYASEKLRRNQERNFHFFYFSLQKKRDFNSRKLI